MRSPRVLPKAFAIALTAGLVTTWPGQTGADGHSPVTTVAVHVLHSPKVPPRSTPHPISDASSTNTRNWTCIGTHESNNDYTRQGGGAFQFQGTTWYSVTGLTGSPESYAPSIQNAAALKLWHYDLRGWGTGWHAWSTRFVCGLG